MAIYRKIWQRDGHCTGHEKEYIAMYVDTLNLIRETNSLLRAASNNFQQKKTEYRAHHLFNGVMYRLGNMKQSVFCLFVLFFGSKTSLCPCSTLSALTQRTNNIYYDMSLIAPILYLLKCC